MAGRRIDDDRGVSSAIDMIFTFVIASLIFTLLLMNLNALFIDNPKEIVTRNQLEDVGNGVSTMLIDTYLIAPDNGAISTTLDMPNTVVGTPYTVDVVKKNNDREVSVTTFDKSIFVNMTLNGVNSTMPINGTTNSTDELHRITYTPNT